MASRFTEKAATMEISSPGMAATSFARWRTATTALELLLQEVKALSDAPRAAVMASKTTTRNVMMPPQAALRHVFSAANCLRQSVGISAELTVKNVMMAIQPPEMAVVAVAHWNLVGTASKDQVILALEPHQAMFAHRSVVMALWSQGRRAMMATIVAMMAVLEIAR